MTHRDGFAKELRALVRSTGMSAKEVARRLAAIDGDRAAVDVSTRERRWETRLSSWQLGHSLPADFRDLRLTLDFIYDLLAASGRRHASVSKSESRGYWYKLWTKARTERGRSTREPSIDSQPKSLGSDTDAVPTAFEQSLRALLVSGRLNLARREADGYLMAARNNDDQLAIARIATLAGQAMRRLGELDHSIEYLNEAVAAAEGCDASPSPLASALDHLGLTLRRQGNLTGAERVFARAMTVSHSSDSVANVAQTMSYLALVHRDRGKLDRAVRLLTESCSLLEREPECIELARALSALGTVEVDLEKPDIAIRTFHRALDVTDNLGDAYERAIILGQRARGYIRLGDYELARLDAVACLQLNRKFNTQEGIAVGLLRLGQVAMAGGEVHQASGYLIQAYELFEAIKHPYWCIIAGCQLARCFSLTGRIGDSESLMSEAITRAAESEALLAAGYVESVRENLGESSKG